MNKLYDVLGLILGCENVVIIAEQYLNGEMVEYRVCYRGIVKEIEEIQCQLLEAFDYALTRIDYDVNGREYLLYMTKEL